MTLMIYRHERKDEHPFEKTNTRLTKERDFKTEVARMDKRSRSVEPCSSLLSVRQLSFFGFQNLLAMCVACGS